ncbi:MAG: DedA-family rane protein [Bryobacterales bacterium]|nr:DedA-family rane protein [Bryobacterales bacterium]
MDHIAHLVVTYGYPLIFLLVFIDQAAVSIPSPPFVTTMGVLASSGRFNIWSAFVVVFGAALLADCLWFGIGVYTANGLLNPRRSTHWNERFSKISARIRRGVLGATLTVKFSLLPSALVPLAAGSTLVPVRRFLYAATIGNLAWTVVFLVGGFTAGYTVMNFFGHRDLLVATTLGCCLILVLPRAFRTLFRLG